MQQRTTALIATVAVLLTVSLPVAAVTIDTWESNTDYPFGADDSSAGTINDRHYVTGGDSFATGDVTSAVYYYNADTESWVQSTDMPSDRWQHETVGYNNDLWVMGGYPTDSASNPLTTVDVYNPGTDSWSSRPDVPITGPKYTAGVANGNLYVLNSSGDMASYNPSRGWEIEPSAPVGAQSSGADGYDGDLYVSGGQSDLNGMYRYDTGSESWSQLSDIPSDKSAHALATVGGEIWIWGGNSGATYSYDVADDSYTTEQSGPFPSGISAYDGMSAADGYLYTTAGNYFNDSNRYVTPYAVDYYNVSGIVRNQSNDRVSGAEITVVNVSDGTEVGTDTTTSLGYYDVGQLQNGTYEIYVNKSGYVNQSQQFQVNGDDVGLDFELRSFSASIEIDTRDYIEHGQSTPYAVTATLENGTRLDVTDSAVVTSSNTTVVTVDGPGQRLIATDDVSVNNRIYITASYTTPDGKTFTTQQNVTVANATVENIEILPSGPRVSASFNDVTIQVIIVGVMAGVAAAWLASAFAGLSAVTIVMTLGWFAGRVGDGMLLVTIVTSVFIGLNVATNVDMTMMRGR